MHIKKAIFAVILNTLFCEFSLAAPEVLASIKPLQLITQAIMGKAGQSQVLLPPGATPHHYSLRPSDMRKLDQAELIIWLGEESEHYLAKTINKKKSSKGVLDLQPYLMRGDNGYLDPHLWLSSKLAVRVAQAITEKLVALDGSAEDRYRTNLADFVAELVRVKKRTNNTLKGFEIRYLVYHDAYGYFEREHGLSHAGVVSLHPEVNPGARHLLALKNIIEKQAVSCILIEPESNAAILKILTADKNIKTIMLDPMAGDLQPDKMSYTRFLLHVAKTFKKCQT